MNQADQIRQHILSQHIIPARSAGMAELTVRAGDVHKDMGLSSRMPAVCSALDGRKLCEMASISIKRRQGPKQGANVFVTFSLGSHQRPKINHQFAATPERKRRRTQLDIDPASSLVLVSCVKRKLETSAPAEDLYTSPLFEGMKSYAKNSSAPWFVLSAKYGLVSPDEVINPYELTLNNMEVSERKAWAQKVIRELLPKTKGLKHIVVLAGARYREFLIEPLKKNGLEVQIPMSGLRLGEQLSWLSNQS